MPITQRFYPKFFYYALLGDTDTKFTALSGQRGRYLSCKMALMTQAGGVFDEGHGLTSQLSANEVVKVNTAPFNVSLFESVYNGPNTLEFIFPSITFSGLTGTSFRYGVIYRTPTELKGGSVSPLFMHFDFGEVLSPTGDFTISIDFDSCVPRIDFTPVACSVSSGGGGNADVIWDGGGGGAGAGPY